MKTSDLLLIGALALAGFAWWKSAQTKASSPAGSGESDKILLPVTSQGEQLLQSVQAAQASNNSTLT